MASEATKSKVEPEDSENSSKDVSESMKSDEEGSTDQGEYDLKESVASPEESLEDEDESEAMKGNERGSFERGGERAYSALRSLR